MTAQPLRTLITRQNMPHERQEAFCSNEGTIDRFTASKRIALYLPLTSNFPATVSTVSGLASSSPRFQPLSFYYFHGIAILCLSRYRNKEYIGTASLCFYTSNIILAAAYSAISASAILKMRIA